MISEPRKPTHLSPLAERQLEPSIQLPWIAVSMDAWRDLLASKMVALVERGAPRDFRDVFAVCRAGLVSPTACWDLWRTKQNLSAQDPGAGRARLSIESHLERLARLRPLAGIADAAERQNAETLRGFFTGEFSRCPRGLMARFTRMSKSRKASTLSRPRSIPRAGLRRLGFRHSARGRHRRRGQKTGMAHSGGRDADAHLPRLPPAAQLAPIDRATYLGTFPPEIRDDPQLRFV